MAYKVVDKNALVNNILTIRKNFKKDMLFCAVVKSNAYGHGVKKVVLTIDNFVDYFAVASPQEVKSVRQITNKPILVLGSVVKKDLSSAIKCGAEFCVFKMQDIALLIQETKKINYTKQINLHISVNTGMNRLGVDNLSNFKRLLCKISSFDNLKIKGIFSHISDAENVLRTQSQAKIFEIYVKEAKKHNKNIITHIQSTYALPYFDQFNMVRIGIGMYGYSYDFVNPVMSVFAQIVEIKCIKKGEYIGYGSKHICKKDSKIAVIDIGYADGFLRSNARGGRVIIGDKYCDIVGEICMSMCFVDVSNVKCKINDKVVIMGTSNHCKITAKDLAKNTICYEVLTNFSKLET